MTIPVAPAKLSASDPKKIGGVWSFIKRFNDLIDWITSLSPAGATQYATAPVNSTTGFNSGFTGGVSLKRKGTEIQLCVDITGTIPVGSTTLAAGLIPSSYRWVSPQSGFTHNPRGVAYVWGGTGAGHLLTDDAGNLLVVNSSGASATRVQGVLKYDLN